VAYFDTGQDLLAYFLRRCGELFPNDTSIGNADRLIDAKLHTLTGYWDFCAMRPWRWARVDPPVQFATAAKETNSITAGGLTVGSVTVTLDAVIATSQAGKKFSMDGERIPFRISAHTAGTAVLTLAAGYTGVVLSGPCTIFQDEYLVATDILAFPVLKNLHTGGSVRVVPEAELEERFPRNVQESAHSQYAAFIGDGKVRLVPWTPEAQLWECRYNFRPVPLTWDGVGATDTPICPRQVREVIALFGLRRVMTDKRDARIQVIQAEIQERLSVGTSAEMSMAKPRRFVPAGSRVAG